MIQFLFKEMSPNKKEYKEVHYRNLKGIDNQKFRDDIKLAYESTKSDKFPEKINSFHENADKIIESHAPLKTKKVKIVPSAPWFDEEYKTSNCTFCTMVR